MGSANLDLVRSIVGVWERHQVKTVRTVAGVFSRAPLAHARRGPP